MTAAAVAIVGYGMGNIGSLMNAFSAIGADAFVAERPEQLRSATHLVLPGVGAFAVGMRRLQELGFDDEIRRHVAAGGPILGVCLGMQLLATCGEEHGITDGLGLVPGRSTMLDSRGLRLPHIGWNDSMTVRESRLFGSIGTRRFYYYVHSFVLRPDDPRDVAVRCDYGEPFVAAIERANIFGTQFHPEKSQASGLETLRRFASLEC